MKQIRWNNLSLASKLVFEVSILAGILFAMNVSFYMRINHSMQMVDQVYVTNADITELGQAFEKVQDNVYRYLKVKSSQALNEYYQSEGNYRELLGKLNGDNVNDSGRILEKNIKRMSETYLEHTAETVAAKRGRNIEKYKKSYDSATELYYYIQSALDELNKQQFQVNSNTYASLRRVMNYLEISNTVFMIVVVAGGVLFLIFSTRDMFRPLTNMAETAAYVGQGNFNMKMPDTDAQDELGVVTRAFNTMVESLGIYMEKTKASMEKEQQMMERELLMETHLKEAQLKYLQSQINPHFLFNSLNAGAQLAMMEDAEKTGIFVEKMADFFRYNVKKGEGDATLEEELEAVDNYIYILNVRFAGDIHFTKTIDEQVENIRIPSMILQPVVENAVNHGIRDIEWEGQIDLRVKKEENALKISILDNGKGMSQAQIEKVLSGQSGTDSDQTDSTGIGMNNVRSRLELYYAKEGLLHIYSEGEGKGTEVVITVPLEKER